MEDATSPSITSFLKAAAVDILGSHTYRVNLDKAFCIGSVPNGGYVAACILAAAKLHLTSKNQPDTLTSHFEYPDRAAKGSAIITVEDVKLGKQKSILHLTLWQDGLLDQAPWTTPNVSRRVVLAYTNQINMQNFTGISLPTAYEEISAAQLPPIPNFAALEAENVDEVWEEQKPPQSSDIAQSLRNWRFYLPRAGHIFPGVVDIWMRMANGERITQLIMPYLLDSFPYNLHVYTAAPGLREVLQPPPVEQPANPKEPKKAHYDEPRASLWFPTVVMDFEMKACLPEDGVEWVTMRVVTKRIQDGRFDLEVMVRTTDGEIVALSHHVAMIVSIERNMAKRGSKAKAAL